MIIGINGTICSFHPKNPPKGRDFAGYWWGDCIDAAATVLSEIVHKQIDISIKSQFLFVLKHIAYTFRNIIYGQDKDENNDYNIARAISNVRNHKPIIELVTRPWNNLDAKYQNIFMIKIKQIYVMVTFLDKIKEE